MCVRGLIGLEGRAFNALRIVVGMLFQGENTASGSSSRAAAIFSSIPPAKTRGIPRVDALDRSAAATARPCEGRRSRSITMAAGGFSLMVPITRDVLRRELSTLKPASRKAAARSSARSAFQQMRRIGGEEDRALFSHPAEVVDAGC